MTEPLIYPDELKDKLDRKEDFLLLDVRTLDEWNLAKIEGALLIPMQELEQRIEEIDAHRDREIVVMCRTGNRSGHMQKFLLDKGFKVVRNLAGGIDRWSLEVDPRVPRY